MMSFVNAQWLYKRGNLKGALRVAKDFRINVTAEERDVMATGYECIVHPEFYKQLGYDLDAKIHEADIVCRRILKIEENV